MNEQWTKEVLSLVNAPTDQEARRYCELVYRALGQCDLQTARVLLKTFIHQEDYDGVQECVVAVLASAEPRIHARAVLEESRRLMSECPEWAEDLLVFSMRSTDAFKEALKEFDLDTQQAVFEFVSRRLGKEPEVAELLRALGH